MRIVQLNPFFFPYAGGTERRILEIGKRLARRHEVHVVTARLPGTPERETLDGIEVHRMPSSFRLEKLWNPPLVATRGLTEAIGRIRPDVVDYHYRWAPTYGRAFARARRRAKLAFTYNNSFGEGTGLLRWASLANDAWTKRGIARADAILCVSRWIQSDLAARGFPADRLRVVPNGVDADAVQALADQGRVPPAIAGKRYLACVGRLVPIKGYETAIEALARLPDDVHLALCGEGPERARLLALATTVGAAGRVHLLGWVPEADKMRLVRDSIGFLHPTRFEAFGLAPLEAMAAGAPIAASDVGGLTELVEGAGTLVPPQDPGALAEAAEAWLTPRLRKAASEASQRRARAYSWDDAAAAAERAYEGLLERPLSAGQTT